MERRKFTREFKLEAVRLIKDRGVSFGQASETWASIHRTSRLGEEASATIPNTRFLATAR